MIGTRRSLNLLSLYRPVAHRSIARSLNRILTPSLLSNWVAPQSRIHIFGQPPISPSENEIAQRGQRVNGGSERGRPRSRLLVALLALALVLTGVLAYQAA